MDWIILFFMVLNSLWCCNGASYQEQMDHIRKTRRQSLMLDDDHVDTRRLYDPRQIGNIIGIPSLPNHLPGAEPIQPGHTLLRPAFGMLKSAVKFPHKEYEDGAGVYGNFNNLGIKFGGKNERLLYSGFRRMPGNFMPEEDTGNAYDSRWEMSDRKPNHSELPAINRKNVIKELLSRYIARNQCNLKNNKDIYIELGKRKAFEGHDLRRLNDLDKIRAPSIYVPTIEQDKNNNQSDASVYGKKLQWLYKSKHMYDNIRINQEAPDISEFIPIATIKNARPFWYFHQDDFKPFEKSFLIMK